MANVEDQGPQVIAVAIVFLALCILSTSSRCYAKLNIAKKSFGLDDWFMLFATITFIVFAVLSIVDVQCGLGRHQTDLTPGQFVSILKYWWLASLGYGVSIALSRISIGFLLLRLPVSRVHRYLIYTSIFLSAVFGTFFTFFLIFQCRPVAYYWDRDQDGSCLNQEISVNLTYPFMIQALFCDFISAVLPMFIIQGLNMDRGTKIGLRIILGIGCIAIIAVLVRVPLTHHLAESDFTWNAAQLVMWNMVEPGLAITCGNLAVVRPLFCKISQILGLKTSSAAPVLSNQLNPPTVGSANISGAKQISHDSSFGLSTLLEEDIREDREYGSDNQIKYNEPSAATGANTSNSLPGPPEGPNCEVQHGQGFHITSERGDRDNPGSV